MRAIVIGSAAGGGFPQWNCGCGRCDAVRRGAPGFLPRTQDSVLVTAAGAEGHLLLNASPDVHAQIRATRSLWPRAARHTPVGAVVLTNGDLDHVLGLFSLRESQPLAVYATDAVWRGLEANVFIRTLRRFDGQLVKRSLRLGEAVSVANPHGAPLGLEVTAFPLAGKLPVHLVGHGQASPEDNIGLLVREPRGVAIAYAAAFAAVGPELREPRAAMLLDGTFYSETELAEQGLSRAAARDMAHLPVIESAMALRAVPGRKIYTHINNTNPLLDPSSDETRAVLEAGFEIAFDGMEIDV